MRPVKGLTIDFGKFVTTAGAEVIEANKNWLYSRSIAFFNIPLLHNGFRAGYKVNDMLSLQLSVVNGWNGVGINPDITGAKTYGASVNVTVPGGLNIVGTTYIGKNEAICRRLGRASPDTRILGDLVVAYAMGALGLNLNFDYVKDEGAGFYDTMVVSRHGPLRRQRRVRAGSAAANTVRTTLRRGPPERARGHRWRRVPDGQPPRGAPRGPRRLPGRRVPRTATACRRRTWSPAPPRCSAGSKLDAPNEHSARVALRRRGRFLFRRPPRPPAAYVRRRMSLSTPAAVTAGPAPGPVMTSGFLR